MTPLALIVLALPAIALVADIVADRRARRVEHAMRRVDDADRRRRLRVELERLDDTEPMARP